MAGRTVQFPDAPEDSDFFEEKKLGLQWQWNANYKEEWYSLDGKALTLYAQRKDEGISLCDVPNLLLQKWPAPEFAVTVCMHLEEMKDGDVCGMVSFGGRYDSLLVRGKGGKKTLCQRTGMLLEKEETDTELTGISGDLLYLRMKVEAESKISWEAGESEEALQPIGIPTETLPGRWVGVKSGLVALHEGEGSSGQIKIDFFRYDHLLRKNRIQK